MNHSFSKISRREFFKRTGVVSGGFILAYSLPTLGRAEEPIVESTELNAYIVIQEDGKILIYSGAPEMGQGIKTSLPMIVAEELGAAWEDVIVKQTPEVNVEKYGRQSTGGSYTLYRNWNLMREMGATAREMLLGAGALLMEIPKSELEAVDSQVRHRVSDRSMSFAELASVAQKQAVPDSESLKFKPREDYRILGTSKSQVDSLEIVTGIGDYGIDTKVKGMLFGCYEKCEAVGGRIVDANLTEIKRLPGIVDAYIVKGNGKPNELMDGVGIVGTNTWSVFNARKKLKVSWDETQASKASWSEFKNFARGASKEDSEDKINIGEINSVLTDPQNTVLESFYEYPYVSHLCLEPMNCTADYRKGENGKPDHLEIWLPTQNGPRFQKFAKDFYGLEQDQLTIHIKRMGGSFGRRNTNDYVSEAIELSKRSGRPVKLTWSREDSMKGDFFREGGFNKIRGVLDPKGKLIGWDEHLIRASYPGKPGFLTGPWPSAFPFNSVDNVRASLSTFRVDTPTGAWRAPYSNTHAFVSQSFIHELATEANRDHLEFLLEMMGDPRWLSPGQINALNTERAIGVLKKVARETQLQSTPARNNRGLGLAFYFCHAAHVAEVADVTVTQANEIFVNKVTAAVDVGPIINMSGALNQVEGSIMDGLSTMVGQKITMENGRIEQTNLDKYPVLRINAAPDIEVHFIESDYDPTGLGEPALPPLAPAIANAIFEATGARVRTMPLTDLGYTI